LSNRATGLTTWFGRVCGAWARCRRGVTAIEAALVMPAFALMTFGIIETAMLYFAAAALEGQVGEASRQIRTGNVQKSGDPAAEFRNLLCDQLGGLVRCSDVIIDVRRFNSFNSVNYPPYVDEDGMPSDASFTPGGPGDVVLVRVTYRWQILTPFLAYHLGDGGTSSKQLQALAVFRNEPYEGAL